VEHTYLFIADVLSTRQPWFPHSLFRPAVGNSEIAVHYWTVFSGISEFCLSTRTCFLKRVPLKSADNRHFGPSFHFSADIYYYGWIKLISFLVEAPVADQCQRGQPATAPPALHDFLCKTMFSAGTI